MFLLKRKNYGGHQIPTFKIFNTLDKIFTLESFIKNYFKTC